MVCVDVFSRFMYTELLKTKESERVSEAFRKNMGRARGNTAIKAKSQTASVQEVSTDTGAEFKGPFEDMLEKQGISHRYKEFINSPAVVDAALRPLKVMIAKEMADTGSESARILLPATRARHVRGSSYNSRHLQHR